MIIESKLAEIIAQLADRSPSTRTSEKRRLLEGNGEAIFALHQRGFSWSALARELSSATGEPISPDLLRTACSKRSRQRRIRRAKAPVPATVATPSPLAASTPKPASSPSRDKFGAKGLMA